MYSTGHRVSGPLFTTSLKKKGDSPPVFMVIVSKKVSNRAVDRNLIKRRVRAILTPLLKDLPPGSLLTIHTQKAVLRESFSRMCTELSAQAEQLMRRVA